MKYELEFHYRLCRNCRVHGWWEWHHDKDKPSLVGFTFFRWSVAWRKKI